MKAFYIDTDNLCNFENNSNLFKEYSKGDKVYVFYTRVANMNKAEETLNKFCGVFFKDMEDIELKQGYQSLDLHLIDTVRKNMVKYSKNIVISNDKGYVETFNGLNVTVRGTSTSTKKRETKEIDNLLSFEEKIRKFTSDIKIRLDRLENLRGKYVVANINNFGTFSYIKDKSLNDIKTWSTYLYQAYGFTSPEYALETLNRWDKADVVLIYVSDSLVDREKNKVNGSICNSLNNLLG